MTKSIANWGLLDLARDEQFMELLRGEEDRERTKTMGVKSGIDGGSHE